jgi:hypothetical protein
MGCANVHLESWGEFGMGWRQRNVWVRMTAPDAAVFIANIDVITVAESDPHVTFTGSKGIGKSESPVRQAPLPTRSITRPAGAFETSVSHSTNCCNFWAASAKMAADWPASGPV